MIEIVRLKTPEAVAAEAASRAAKAIAEAQQSHQLATFVLAGGRLPPVATAMLSQKYSDTFDWAKVAFLIGDERCVPLDDPDSSWLSALPLFAAHPEISKQNKLRPQSNLPAEQAAEAYANTLMGLEQNQPGVPSIDHLWFGIGEDGHTLSLFPGHPSLELAKKTDQLVIPVHDSPKPPPDRISFSLKALEGVRSAVVFISGASKAPIVAQIASGDRSLPIVIVSQTIDKAGGHVTWLVDDEAASQLPAGQALTVE